MSTNNEFTIRVTGAAPPPLPTKGKKKAASKKNTASQQQQRRYNMRLRPSTSINQLRKDVYALFNIPTDHIKSYQMSFLSGFPPKELEQTGKSTVHELGIRPNESITIRFTLVNSSSGGSTAKQSTANVKQQQSEPVEEETAAASSSTGRQKRASAMAATASFKDVIAAQDAIMKNEKKKVPKRKTKSTTGGNISGFGNTTSTVSKKSKQPKKVKMEGSGFRLSDGKSFAGSSPSKKKSATGKQKGGEAMFRSEDDVASKLLSSFGGSGGGGNVSKYLRSAMKGAVTKSYEASRAAVRVTAVTAGEYSFEKVKGGSLVNGGTVLGTANDADESSSTPDNGLGRTLYTVQYSKGMEGRGRYDEKVEIIGLVALKAVLNHVYDSSNGTGEEEDEVGGEGSQDGRLRPVMIAQLSPRAFWSLVFHCKESAQASTSPLSVEDMLRSTLPQLDWSHLERGGRKRVLSEKARENKRQTESTIAPGDATQNNGDQEAMAIEQLAESALEAATAGNEEEVALNERERRAKAAMARFRTDERKPPVSTAIASKGEDTSIDDDWTLVTPVEDDIDELIECIMEGSDEGYDDDMAKAWATILVDSVQNWRVLANSDAEYIKSILAKKDCSTTTVEIIQGWIDAAQGRALEEIMLEILDGDQDALDVLQDKAKSSSPRDLVFWKVRPEILADALNSDTSKSWTLTDVKKWIKRAEVALGTCTWLEQYTSGGLVNM